MLKCLLRPSCFFQPLCLRKSVPIVPSHESHHTLLLSCTFFFFRSQSPSRPSSSYSPSPSLLVSILLPYNAYIPPLSPFLCPFPLSLSSLLQVQSDSQEVVIISPPPVLLTLPSKQLLTLPSKQSRKYLRRILHKKAHTEAEKKTLEISHLLPQSTETVTQSK